MVYSGFAADILAGIFSNSCKIGLGSGELVPVSGGGYADQSGSKASWAHTTENGRPTVTNNAKFYFPDVTAAYTASYIHIKQSFGGKTDALLVSMPITDSSGDPNPLTAAVGEQIKVNKYAAGAGRGIKVQLWLPEV